MNGLPYEQLYQKMVVITDPKDEQEWKGAQLYLERGGEYVPVVTRSQIVAEALSWQGTKWGHQQNIKGLSADCEGYVEGVALNTGVQKVIDVIRNYRKREDGSLMLQLLKEQLDFVTGNSGREAPDMSKALPADILAFCDERLAEPDKPKHLGFLTKRRVDGVLYVSHASEHGVVNHRMDARWLKRIHSVWAIRGIINDLAE